ncbi:hypothetical protein F5Y05DRAFT_420267 [Hypoxylon sp. FL0543]|nr:hypothetical protein F5Y05DRAFT_420267 [Hypoxylon sp. FL0543]
MDTANTSSSTSPPLPTASGPCPVSMVNSPSVLSYYSSGASHTSTRNTSPDSVAAISVYSGQESRSPLLELNLTADIEHTPNTLLERQPTKMDRNPFQSVNERRNKLATDRNSAHQVQQPQQPFQNQTLRSSMQPLSVQPRGPGLASANWRSQAAAEEAAAALSARGGGSGTGAGEYSPFDPSSPVGHPMASSSMRQHSHPTYTSTRMESFPRQQLQQPSGIAPYPNQGSVSELQLESSYAYCYDRGNGQYTRLIPADMLPPLKDIPALQQSCSGMIVLPQPRTSPPNGRSSNTEPVALRGPPNAPGSSSDTIQSRIDTIIAATPPTPPSHHQPSLTLSSAGGVSGLGPGSTPTAAPASHTHHPPHRQSHHGGHSSHGGHGEGGSHGNQQQQQPQRRPKIYCDKWVHEGVCAFTQQGCKYKHEMPFDKVTQHQLGLFHGFPAWWKKHQADLSRQRDGPGLGIAGAGAGAGAGGASGGEEGARERFMGRGGAAGVGGGGGSAGGAGGGEGAVGVGAGIRIDPTIPNWRRSGGEFHASEQKTLGSGRGMARGVGVGVINPMISYGSRFGPIAPPSRGPTATPALPVLNINVADPAGSGQPPSQQTGGAGGASHSGGAGGGAPATSPYTSFDSLEETDNLSPDAVADEEESSPSAASSSGARLARGAQAKGDK